ncbi:MAG: hypothetical protein IJ529_02590 [Alphaproteobacteria bacterium]|nr:hypothetical protein [Alphaproteobacteria bacterium]
MTKNYNGYFSMYDENKYDDDVLYNLKVENNKIVGASFSVDRHMKKEELEDLLKEVIGEDFKDFLIEKMLDQQYGENWTVKNEHDDLDLFDRYKIEEARHADDLALSEQGYQDKIASILQSKENRIAHGNMLNRISEIKNKQR